MKYPMMVAAALIALSAPAAAQCAQEQLTGDWTLVGSNNGQWTRCEMTVGADGAWEGRCRGTGRPRRGTPVEGVLEVVASCNLTGTLGSGQGRVQAIEGVLEEDGAIGAGVTKFGTRRQNFGLLFTLVRRP